MEDDIAELKVSNPRHGISSKEKALKRIPVAIAIPILCIPVLAGILIGWYCRIHDFQNGGGTTEFVGRNIFLQANLVAIDPRAGTMSMDWFITRDSTCDPSSGNTSDCSNVNIYFDMNALDAASNKEIGASNNRPKTPLFEYNATSLFLDDARADMAAFRTPIALMSPEEKSASLQDYPFDEYSAQIFMYAYNADTDAQVGISISGTRGIAVGFAVKAMRNNRFRNNDVPGVIENKIRITRGALIKTYALIVMLSIWSITLIFLLATISSIIFGFQQRENVLVIPVACLFAFTQLRTTMPGAPEGFGAIIDYVGLLPCLAVITLSAALTLGSLVLSDPTKDRVTIFDRMLHKLRRKEDAVALPSLPSHALQSYEPEEFPPFIMHPMGR